MSPLFIAIFLKPFAALLLAVCVLIPARRAVVRWWPEGRVKRLLLMPVSLRRTHRADPK